MQLQKQLLLQMITPPPPPPPFLNCELCRWSKWVRRTRTPSSQMSTHLVSADDSQQCSNVWEYKLASKWNFAVSSNLGFLQPTLPKYVLLVELFNFGMLNQPFVKAVQKLLKHLDWKWFFLTGIVLYELLTGTLPYCHISDKDQVLLNDQIDDCHLCLEFGLTII